MQITNSEIQARRELMPDYTPGLEALDQLETSFRTSISSIIKLYSNGCFHHHKKKPALADFINIKLSRNYFTFS